MLNRKGFMMAEVIVVSSIILIFLTSLYLSYNKLYAAYNSRIDYYDTVTLYRLAYYKSVLIEENKMDNYQNAANGTNGYVKITDSIKTNDVVYMIYNNKNNINGTILDSTNIHPTFKEYVAYLSTSVTVTDSEYVMVMESCVVADDCKYAYLKV